VASNYGARVYGVRGLVSLAIALAIPLTNDAGQAFPYRDAILFLTFAVILVTLVGQGLTLPFVISSAGSRQYRGARKDDTKAPKSELHARSNRSGARAARAPRAGWKICRRSSLMDSAHVTMIAGDNLNIAEEVDRKMTSAMMKLMIS